MTDADREPTEAGRLANAGKLAEALDAYDRFIAANPSHPEARFNRAVVLKRQGHFDDSFIGFQSALDLSPEWPVALLALGELEFIRNQYREAEAWFQRAAFAAPNSAEALCNLGIAQLRQMHPARALPALARARELAPMHEVPWYELRRALQLLGRGDEAHRDFLRFEKVAAPSARLICTALWTSRHVAGEAMERRYLPLALAWPYGAGDLEALSGLLCILPYYDVSRESTLALYQTYDRLAQGLRGGVADLGVAPEDAGGRLRIGFLSADFRTHIMGRIVEAIVSRYDRQGFEFRLYSLMPLGGEDALTARLREGTAGYTQLAGLTDYAAARQIASDELHILVDLMGHTTWAQPGILVFKPAPVIVTHLGFHGTIGLRQVDFKITDAVADLPDAGQFQIETPLPMAGSIVPIRQVTNGQATNREVTKTHVAGAHAVVRPPDAKVVFGAFVGPQMSPRCLSAWARIFARLPGARLLFSPQAADEHELYRQRAESFGIDRSRIDFLPMTLDEAQDRARYAAVDVVLDALPYTGGDSAACAVAEGVPFVTRCGQRHAERVATSVLTHLGVTESIARSDDEYVEIAVRLAEDRAWRERIASDIRAALPDHDAAMTAYTRSLEAALREAWRLRRRGGATPLSAP